MASWLREKNEQPQLTPPWDPDGKERRLGAYKPASNTKDRADFLFCKRRGGIAPRDENNVNFKMRTIEN